MQKLEKRARLGIVARRRVVLTVGGEVLAFVNIMLLSIELSGSGPVWSKWFDHNGVWYSRYPLRLWNDLCFVIALYSERNAARHTLLSIFRYCVR